MKIGLLGCGVVGGGVLNILENDPNMQVTTILDLRELPNVGCRVVHDINEILNDAEIDLIIETMGGDRPAFDFVSAALKAGKHVVSSNKLLVAAHYEELIALAKENNVAFRCTAAVGGGIPWLTNLGRAAKHDCVKYVGGIMNGTTNYILDRMTEEGCAFEEVLKDAQRLGYAEANPAADIDGLDVRRKIHITANIAFGVLLRETEIPCFGIRNITEGDIKTFAGENYVCRLIGSAKPGENGVAAQVIPTLFKHGAPEAAVHQNFNRIAFEADKLGAVAFFGQGAGRYPTAVNVVQDCSDILSGVRSFYTEHAEPCGVDTSEKQVFYIRTVKEVKKPEIAETVWGDGFITKPVSIAELLKLGERICFAAKVN